MSLASPSRAPHDGTRADSVRAVTGTGKRLGGRLTDLAAVVVGAVVLRLIAGVGFANYDTLYALAWGGQLAQGETPAYGVPISPTPHPLIELLGIVLRPLSAHAEIQVVVWLGFLALAGCGVVIFRLGEAWLGAAAGALAALLFLTRVPVLSYGVRAYLDVPYVLLVLGALLVEVRRPRAGAPVLALLALAGLLRPEAWVFSALYWLYLVGLLPAWLRARLPDGEPLRGRGPLSRVTLLAASGPLVWLGSDLVVTGQPLWSLTHTRHTASALDRRTGIANVPQYLPRRIGEVLQAAALAGAVVGAVAVAALAAQAGTRAGAGGARWPSRSSRPSPSSGSRSTPATRSSPRPSAACSAAPRCSAGPRSRRATSPARSWMAAGALVALALIATAPSQYRTAHRELRKLAAQERIEGDLVALVGLRRGTLRCGPVGVPNHAPIPLLALYLRTSPGADPQRGGRAHLLRRLRRPGEHNGRTRLRPRQRTTPTRRCPSRRASRPRARTARG